MTGSFSLPEINVFWLPDSNSVHKVYNSLLPFACGFSRYNFYYMLEKKNKTYTCMHCRKSLTAPSLRKKLNMITWDTGCSSLLLQGWLTQAILYIRKLMPSWPSNCVNHSLSQTGNNGPHYIASVSHFHQLPLEGATTFMLEKRDLGCRIKKLKLHLCFVTVIQGPHYLPWMKRKLNRCCSQVHILQMCCS